MRSRFILLVTSSCLLVTILGCDAFVRKFTRKPKNQENLEEQMILAPEEYNNLALNPSQEYQQYFLFWKSWQDELIVALQENRSQKKKIDCLKEAIRSLENLVPLLGPEPRESLSRYIEEEKKLLNSIAGTVYGSSGSMNITTAERLKRGILRD